MRHLFENHDLETAGRGQFVDITDDVVSMVDRSGVLNGMALVYSPGTDTRTSAQRCSRLPRRRSRSSTAVSCSASASRGRPRQGAVC